MARRTTFKTNHLERVAIALTLLITLTLAGCVDRTRRGGGDDDDERNNGVAANNNFLDGDTPTFEDDVPPDDDDADADEPGCDDGAQRCLDAAQVETCQPDGTWAVTLTCADEEVCSDADGCVRPVCAPEEGRCVDERTRELCLPDGSGWGEPEICPGDSLCTDAGRCALARCFPGVLFLVDRSASMAPHWDNVADSMVSAVDRYPGVSFGLSVFPSTALGCGVGPNTPSVPVSDQGSSPIAEWFGENDVAGATPLHDALEWTSQNVSLLWGDLDIGYLVVLSDGADTCTCTPDDTTPRCLERLTEATASLLDQGIRTYVIGYNYNDDPDQLNAIAAAGGTDFTEYVATEDEIALTGVFSDFVDVIEQKGCDL